MCLRVPRGFWKDLKRNGHKKRSQEIQEVLEKMKAFRCGSAKQCHEHDGYEAQWTCQRNSD